LLAQLWFFSTSGWGLAMVFSVFLPERREHEQADRKPKAAGGRGAGFDAGDAPSQVLFYFLGLRILPFFGKGSNGARQWEPRRRKKRKSARPGRSCSGRRRHTGSAQRGRPQARPRRRRRCLALFLGVGGPLRGRKGVQSTTALASIQGGHFLRARVVGPGRASLASARPARAFLMGFSAERSGARPPHHRLPGVGKPRRSTAQRCCRAGSRPTIARKLLRGLAAYI